MTANMQKSRKKTAVSEASTVATTAVLFLPARSGTPKLFNSMNSPKNFGSAVFSNRSQQL
jgi:hypothetical protein